MAYISQFDYYSDSSNWGSFQYVSLFDIVTNYMLIYNDNHSVVNNAERYKVLFHAKKAIQELSYDCFKEVKVLQLYVEEDLKYILPSDYVNFVRLSIYKDHIVRPLVENIQINYATQYLQNSSGTILFDVDGNVIPVDPSLINEDRLNGTLRTMYLNADNPDDPLNGNYGWFYEGSWYFSYNVGGRFGLNTETAFDGPTFRIDQKAGVINFSSSMSGQSCILEYITDGQENGDDTAISVNKLFEDYLYEEINYRLLDGKLGAQEYLVARKKKSRMAKLRNAKIRMSNMHPGRLLMNLRGQDKIIK